MQVLVISQKLNQLQLHVLQTSTLATELLLKQGSLKLIDKIRELNLPTFLLIIKFLLRGL